MKAIVRAIVLGRGIKKKNRKRSFVFCSPGGCLWITRRLTDASVGIILRGQLRDGERYGTLNNIIFKSAGHQVAIS